MYDPDRVRRLKEIMDRHAILKASQDTDERPASGMVGQNCAGYVPDVNSGRLVRIAGPVLSEEILGPGLYDPLMPTAVHAVKISRNRRVTDLANYNIKPGPADYPDKPGPTRLQHNLVPGPAYQLGPPPVSGDLEHPSWLPNVPKTPPPICLSRIHFKPGLSSHEFRDATARELWPPKMMTPSPTAHDPGHLPISRFPFRGKRRKPKTSPAFSFQEGYDPEDRFAINGPFPPPCTAYDIPDRFGESKSKLMYPAAKIRHPPPEITPDGAQYAAPVVHLPDTSHQSTQFMTTRDRFEDTSFKTPGPADFTISRDITLGRPKTGVRIRAPRPANEWDHIPQKETPAVGEYVTLTPDRVTAGYISVIGHHPYDEKEDRPLAFRTTHSTLVKKSFNSHYFKPHAP
jgi:hypothetical protein